VPGEVRAEQGERFILELIDWAENGDPYFFENHHLSPQPVEGAAHDGGEESWIYYDTTKFSGKKVVVRPGAAYTTVDRGVYSVLVWSGSGTFGGVPVQGGRPGSDEVVVAHDRAVRGVEIRNTGSVDLLAIKFFGPDVNPDVPMIARR
jgi:hypothetical protein